MIPLYHHCPRRVLQLNWFVRPLHGRAVRTVSEGGLNAAVIVAYYVSSIRSAATHVVAAAQSQQQLQLAARPTAGLVDTGMAG